MRKVTSSFRFSFVTGLSLGLVAALVLAAFILIGSVFAWQWIYPMPRQLPVSSIQPAGTPATIGELTARVENLENDQAYNLKVFEWKLDQKILVLGWMALLITLIAGYLGIKTYNDLDKIIKERVNSSLEKALYQLDPTNLPIYIYRGESNRKENPSEPTAPLRSDARNSLSKVEERLRLTGLLNTGYITRLDRVSETGITVVPIDDANDEEAFISFINRQSSTLDKEKAGFILYAPFGYTIKTAMNAFPNTVIANMPATVASMVLVVGRGLKNRED